MSETTPPLFETSSVAAQERMVEALLFASADPLTSAQIQARLPHGCEAAPALQALVRRYEGRGVEVVERGGAWAIRTAPDLAPLLAHERVQTRALSRAALETLAIIAYHQPATRAEIEEIRGVAVSKGTVERLLEIGWIGLGPRREAPGRPSTFVVTAVFLDHFGLRSTTDLPAMRELRAAGLLDATPPAGRTNDLRESLFGDGVAPPGGGAAEEPPRR